MADALRATGRDILFAVAADDMSGASAWAAKAGVDLVRSTHDGTPIDFDGGLQTGPWNDLGLLQSGTDAVNPEEFRMRMNLWAMRASPLMLGNDVRIMMRDTVTLLTNRDVIAVDQDALGRAGRRVAQTGATEAWARPLSGGAMALAFFNRGDAPARVDVSWKAAGLNGPYRVHDLWWHQDIGKANGGYSVYLLPHTSVMVRLDR
jgi:alpha-galactosidase